MPLTIDEMLQRKKTFGAGETRPERGSALSGLTIDEMLRKKKSLGASDTPPVPVQPPREAGWAQGLYGPRLQTSPAPAASPAPVAPPVAPVAGINGQLAQDVANIPSNLMPAPVAAPQIPTMQSSWHDALATPKVAAPVTLAGPKPQGMVEQGNIDLMNRPDVKNADGTRSSVRSISVGIDNQEVLIPTVSEDGRIMSDDEAIEQYRKTGRHLGKFTTPAEATAYADTLHKQQEGLGRKQPIPFTPPFGGAAAVPPRQIGSGGLAARAGKQYANKALLNAIERNRPSTATVEATDVMSRAMKEADLPDNPTTWSMIKSLPRLWWAITKSYYAPETEKAGGAVKEMRPGVTFDVPEATTTSEKAVDVAAGLGAFLTDLLVAKKLVPTGTMLGDAVAWEVVNRMNGGLPGEGAAMSGALGAIGKSGLPGPLRTAAESAFFAGMTAAEGGNMEDILLSAGIPVALAGVRHIGSIKTWAAFKKRFPKFAGNVDSATHKEMSHIQARKEVMSALKAYRKNPGDANAEARWRAVTAKYGGAGSLHTEAVAPVAQPQAVQAGANVPAVVVVPQAPVVPPPRPGETLSALSQKIQQQVAAPEPAKPPEIGTGGVGFTPTIQPGPEVVNETPTQAAPQAAAAVPAEGAARTEAAGQGQPSISPAERLAELEESARGHPATEGVGGLPGLPAKPSRFFTKEELAERDRLRAQIAATKAAAEAGQTPPKRAGRATGEDIDKGIGKPILDVSDHPGLRPEEREALTEANRTGKITIYRAVVKGQPIRAGDHVTLRRSDAEQYVSGPDTEVISQEVDVADVDYVDGTGTWPIRYKFPGQRAPGEKRYIPTDLPMAEAAAPGVATEQAQPESPPAAKTTKELAGQEAPAVPEQAGQRKGETIDTIAGQKMEVQDAKETARQAGTTSPQEGKQPTTKRPEAGDLVSNIEKTKQAIEEHGDFWLKIDYGPNTRPDILRASTYVKDYRHIAEEVLGTEEMEREFDGMPEDVYNRLLEAGDIHNSQMPRVVVDEDAFRAPFKVPGEPALTDAERQFLLFENELSTQEVDDIDPSEARLWIRDALENADTLKDMTGIDTMQAPVPPAGAKDFEFWQRTDQFWKQVFPTLSATEQDKARVALSEAVGEKVTADNQAVLLRRYMKDNSSAEFFELSRAGKTLIILQAELTPATPSPAAPVEKGKAAEIDKAGEEDPFTQVEKEVRLRKELAKQIALEHQTGLDEGYKPVQFTVEGDDRNRGAILTRSAKGKDKWQLTFFDKQGFSNDMSFTSAQKAIEEALQYGYKPAGVKDVLGELSKTPEFKAGNKTTKVVQWINAGIPGIQKAYDDGGYDAALKVFNEYKATKSTKEKPSEPETQAITEPAPSAEIDEGQTGEPVPAETTTTGIGSRSAETSVEIETGIAGVTLWSKPGDVAKGKAIAKKMADIPDHTKPVNKTRRAGLTKPKALPKKAKTAAEMVKTVHAASLKKLEYNESGEVTTRYPGMLGVLVDGDKLVAIDGHRLFVAKGDWGKSGIYPDQVALKRGGLGKSDPDALFPKYEGTIPDYKESDKIAIAAPHDLQTVWRRVRQANVLTSDDPLSQATGILVLKNTDGTLGFASSDVEMGHAEINIQQGAKILGAVDPKFLLDSLAFHAQQGDTIIDFYFPAADKPMMTRAPSSGNLTVTMPKVIERSADSIKAVEEQMAKPSGGKVGPIQTSIGAAANIDLDAVLNRAAKQSKTQYVKQVKGKWQSSTVQPKYGDYYTVSGGQAALTKGQSVFADEADALLAAQYIANATTKPSYVSDTDNGFALSNAKPSGEHTEVLPAGEGLTADEKEVLESRATEAGIRQQEGAKIGYKKGSVEATRAARKKLAEAMLAQQLKDKFRQDAIDVVMEYVPKAVQGRYVKRINKATTGKRLDRLTQAINEYIDRAEKRQAKVDFKSFIKDLTKKYRRGKDKLGGLRSDVGKQVQAVLDTYDFAKLSAAKQNKLEARDLYIKRVAGSLATALETLRDEGQHVVMMPDSVIDEVNRLSKVSITSLSADQIRYIHQTLERLVKIAERKGDIKHRIRQERLEKLANTAIKEEVHLRGTYGTESERQWLPGIIKGLATHQQATPRTLVGQITTAENDATVELITKNLYKANSDTISKEREFIEESLKIFENYRISGDDLKMLDKKVTITIGGKTVDAPLGTVLDLYCHIRAEGNLQQLLKTQELEIVIEDRDPKTGYIAKRKRIVHTGTPSLADLRAIVDVAEKQYPKLKVFSDASFEINRTLQQPALNERSMSVANFEIARQDPYYHISRVIPKRIGGKTTSLGLAPEDGGRYQPRTGSRLPIRISDWRSSFMVGLQEDAAYYGMTEPMQDVRALVNNPAWQKKMVKSGERRYLETLITMINRIEGAASDKAYVDQLGANVIGQFGQGALSLRISGYGVQMASVPAAYEGIEPKYLVTGRVVATKAMVKEMTDLSDILWKRWRARQFDYVLGSVAAQHALETMVFQQPLPVLERMVSHYAKGDQNAIGIIYEAAKNKVAAETDLTRGSDAFKRKAISLVEEALDTQPQWDMVHRSALTSDPRIWVRAMTMFMSARNAQYNVLLRAEDDYAKGRIDGSEMGRRLAGILFATILVSIVKRLIRHGVKTSSIGMEYIKGDEDQKEKAVAAAKKSLKQIPEQVAVDSILNALSLPAVLGNASNMVYEVVRQTQYPGMKTDMEDVRTGNIFTDMVLDATGIAGSLGTMAKYWLDRDKPEGTFASGADKGKLKWKRSAKEAADKIGALLAMRYGAPWSGVTGEVVYPWQSGKRAVAKEMSRSDILDRVASHTYGEDGTRPDATTYQKGEAKKGYEGKVKDLLDEYKERVGKEPDVRDIDARRRKQDEARRQAGLAKRLPNMTPSDLLDAIAGGTYTDSYKDAKGVRHLPQSPIAGRKATIEAYIAEWERVSGTKLTRGTIAKRQAELAKAEKKERLLARKRTVDNAGN